MSLLTRGSVIAVSLLIAGCATSTLGGNEEAANSEDGAKPAQAASAPTDRQAGTAPQNAQTASTDQSWAGRDLPDYRVASSRAAAASAESLGSGSFVAAPMTSASFPAPAASSAPATTAARPPASRQEMAAATPPPAQPQPRAAAQQPAAQPVADKPAERRTAQQQRPAASGGGGEQQSQGNAPDAKEEQLQRAVQAYAGVSGGYYLNQQCNVLNDAQEREYEWHVSMLTAALARQVRPDVLERARSVTRKNVSEEFAQCDDKAKGLVGEAFEAAQRMNQSITGQTYKGKESDMDLVLNRFGAVSMALAVEKHCERIKEPTRGRVYAALEEVTSSLSKQAGAEKVKQIRATATERVETAFKDGKVTKEQACDPRGAQSLQPVLGELKRMQCEVAGSKEACAQIKS